MAAGFLAASDAIALAAAIVAATWLIDILSELGISTVPADHLYRILSERTPQLAVLAAGLLTWLAAKGHYSGRNSLFVEAKELAAVVLTVAILDGYLQFMMKEQPSRLWLASGWLLAFAFMLASRIGLKRALFQLGPWRCPMVIVGSRQRAEDVRRLVGENAYLGYVVEEMLLLECGLAEVERRLLALATTRKVRYAVVVMDDVHAAENQDVVRLLEERLRLPYGIVPNLQGVSTLDLQLQHFFGYDLVVLNKLRPGRSGPRALLPKRIFDVSASAGLLLVLSPLLLLVAALIKVDRGAVLYGSPRIGRDGCQFKALKFRSMVPDADRILLERLAADPGLRREWERNFKLRDDPRVTPIGRFIRATSIDELPQLLNVLRGEMSLVGPRPLLLDEREYYGVRAFDVYTRVTPGLTGMWQVTGRNDLEYYRRAQLNTWYIRNWSPWIDFVILFKTVFVVIRRVGVS